MRPEHTTSTSERGTTVTPSTFSLAPDGRRRIRVTLDGTAASTGEHFGEVVVRARGSSALDAVLPVAANVQQGSLTVSQNCDKYRLLTSVTSPLVRGTTTAATTLTVNK